MRGLYTVMLLGFLFLPAVSSAVVKDIDAVDVNGRVIDTVTTEQDIYISGQCSEAAGEYVELFVVKNKNNWDDEDNFIDVTGSIETVKVAENGELPLTRVWYAETDQGEYDVAVDIDGDKEYDENEDCIDDDNSVGFTIINKGSGDVRFGSRNPDEYFTWRTTRDDPFVTFMQMRLQADDFEDVRVTSFELEAAGTGHDTRSVIEIILADDRGNDGKYKDGRDEILGRGVYDHNNGTVTIDVNQVIRAGEYENVLVVYLMGNEIEDDDKFRVQVESIEAEGLISDKDIQIDGTPLTSVVMTASGSGDAQDVQRDTESGTVQEENGGEESESKTFLPSFFGSAGSENEEDTEKNEKDGLPPLGVRVTFVLLLGLIALVIVWKTLRALLGSTTLFIQQLRDKNKPHDKFDHRL